MSNRLDFFFIINLASYPKVLQNGCSGKFSSKTIFQMGHLPTQGNLQVNLIAIEGEDANDVNHALQLPTS